MRKQGCIPVLWIHPLFSQYQNSAFSDSLMWFCLHTFFFCPPWGDPLFFVTDLAFPCFCELQQSVRMVSLSCQWSFSILSFFCDCCCFSGLQIELQFSCLFSTEHYFLRSFCAVTSEMSHVSYGSHDPYLMPKLFWLRSLCFPATFSTSW